MKVQAVSQASPRTAFVYVAACFAALGGLLFGYDTGVISGALIFIRHEFSLSLVAQELIVSGALAGAAIGALTGGRLADYFGRKATLIATATIFIVGSLIAALATSPAQLVVGRIVLGLAIGLSSATVPVYISEVSPASERGWQVSLFQLAITVGILAAYFVDYLFAKSEAWRWMIGLAVIPGLIFGLGMIVLPETPRWLAKRGHLERARQVLARIRGNGQVDAELADIQKTLATSHESGSWSELLSPELRIPLIIGVGLAIFQQVTGINTIIYYAPTIIQQAGISSASGAILATAGIGVVNVMMTIVSMWLIDRVGRRILLLVGTAGMIVTLALLSVVFRTHSPSRSLAMTAMVALMAYVASFAISLGPIFWLLISEIYPIKIRGLAQGTAATANWAANLLVSMTFLSLVDALGPSPTFALYGILAVGSWIFSYYLVPETKGRSLEEIERSWRSRPAQA